MRLAELRELPLPSTTVAEGAWDRARRRRRRYAATAAAAAVVLVGASAGGIAVVQSGDRRPGPAPAPKTAESQTPVVTDLPDYAALAASVPALAPDDPPPLVIDPVTRAVLVVSERGGIDVLGDDGRWRRVDVPGLEPTRDQQGYAGDPLRPTGLSPDGTQLGLAQPDRVVVVDLTTGGVRDFDVPGLNDAVVWRDGTHLVVSPEGAARARVLDLSDGTVQPSVYTASTGFAADGSSVTWGRDGALVSSDGTKVRAEMANDGGLKRVSPLVGDEVAVGLGRRDQAGVAVVDRHSGDLRGFLYTEGPDTGLVSAYLLALDGDTVTVAVGVPPEQTSLVVVRWSWRTGEVTPVATVEAATLSGPVG